VDINVSAKEIKKFMEVGSIKALVETGCQARIIGMDKITQT